MKVNFDGLRTGLADDVKALKEVITECLDMLLSHQQDEIKEKFDDVARSVNILCCCYDDTVEGDCSDLSDKMVELFPEDDE